MLQSLTNKLNTNLKPYHYIAYCLTYMTYGSVITGLGPLVPYLSAQTGHQQTQYSFLFFCRAIGFLFGAISLRFLQKKFTFHIILFYSSVSILILLCLFCFVLQLNPQGLILFFGSAACCCLQVTINVSILQVQKNSQLQFWMLICHGIFGIGGLVGPIFVYFFEIYSFIVMGLCIVAIAPFYLIMPSPQDHSIIQQRVSKQGILDEVKYIGHQGAYPAIQHKPQRKVIGHNIELLVSFMFAIYMGLQCSYGSWIASYAVLQDIANKQQATRYSSIFWISITAFRFGTAFLPFKSLKKLFMLSYGFVGLSFLTIVLLMIDFKAVACVFSAITFGMCYSSLFPLLLAIPLDYNLQVSSAQGANFMMWCALGEGILSTMAGYCMAWFSNETLFYLMFLMGAAFVISAHYMEVLYEKQNGIGSKLQLSLMNPESIQQVGYMQLKQIRKQRMQVSKWQQVNK